MTAKVSGREIARLYRVLKQTLSMHCDLRDEYKVKARTAQIAILVSSAFLCSITFASDDLYYSLGFSPDKARFLVGIAAVAAFGFSLALLVLDWSGRAAEHRDAARRWALVLEQFRRTRLEDRTWPEEAWEQLANAYWEAARNSVEIPGSRFNDLKARYLRKVTVSRLKSKYPGCPRIVLLLALRGRHTVRALGDKEVSTQGAEQ